MLRGYDIPPMSEEFYDKMLQAFRPVEITPDTTMETIQYSAGQQAVLTWITRNIGKKPATQTRKVKTVLMRVRTAIHLLWRGYVD